MPWWAFKTRFVRLRASERRLKSYLATHPRKNNSGITDNMREVAPLAHPSDRTLVSEWAKRKNRNHIEHVRTDAGRFSGERTAKNMIELLNVEREIGQNRWRGLQKSKPVYLRYRYVTGSGLRLTPQMFDELIKSCVAKKCFDRSLEQKSTFS